MDEIRNSESAMPPIIKKNRRLQNSSVCISPDRNKAKRTRLIVTSILGGSLSEKIPNGTIKANEASGNVEIRILISKWLSPKLVR